MKTLKFLRSVGPVQAPVELAFAWSQYSHYEGWGDQLLIFTALVDKSVAGGTTAVTAVYPYDLEPTRDATRIPLTYQETPRADPNTGVWGCHYSTSMAPRIEGPFYIEMVGDGSTYKTETYNLDSEQGPLLASPFAVNLATASFENGTFSGVIGTTAAPMPASVKVVYTSDGWKTYAAVAAASVPYYQTGAHDMIVSPNQSKDYVWTFQVKDLNGAQVQFAISADFGKPNPAWDNNYQRNYIVPSGKTIYGNCLCNG
jgi:hypothetical protein